MLSLEAGPHYFCALGQMFLVRCHGNTAGTGKVPGHLSDAGVAIVLRNGQPVLFVPVPVSAVPVDLTRTGTEGQFLCNQPSERVEILSVSGRSGGCAGTCEAAFTGAPVSACDDTTVFVVLDG